MMDLDPNIHIRWKQVTEQLVDLNKRLATYAETQSNILSADKTHNELHQIMTDVSDASITRLQVHEIMLKDHAEKLDKLAQAIHALSMLVLECEISKKPLPEGPEA